MYFSYNDGVLDMSQKKSENVLDLDYPVYFERYLTRSMGGELGAVTFAALAGGLMQQQMAKTEDKKLTQPIVDNAIQTAKDEMELVDDKKAIAGKGLYLLTTSWKHGVSLAHYLHVDEEEVILNRRRAAKMEQQDKMPPLQSVFQRLLRSISKGF